MFAVLRKHAILVAVVMLFASGTTASDASPKITDKVRARPSGPLVARFGEHPPISPTNC